MPHTLQESWCKKGPPTPELITAYTPQPPVPLSPPPPPARPDPEVLGRLVKVADSLGFLLQNSHQVRGWVGESGYCTARWHVCSTWHKHLHRHLHRHSTVTDLQATRYQAPMWVALAPCRDSCQTFGSSVQQGLLHLSWLRLCASWWQPAGRAPPCWSPMRAAPGSQGQAGVMPLGGGMPWTLWSSGGSCLSRLTR
jgi:hypothetical protein